MKFLRDYKGVALIYVVLTIVNVIWVISYQKPNEPTQVLKERNIVINT